MSVEELPGAVFFDLETKFLADEVGGWKNIVKMGISLAVLHTQEDGFRTFLEDDIPELVHVLKQAKLVVGFNHIRFDYEVLRAYSDEPFRELPNLDILVDVHSALGFRLGLDHLAAHTLGEKKSGVGTDAVKWFREGRMDLLEQYCRDDVRITRDLFYYGLEHGHLTYKIKRGSLSRVPVSWRDRLRS
jgi:DEAD/DEAH box helicase domain-containing protein